MTKKTYFISDLHFGIPSREESKVREQLFVDWLEYVKNDADAIYIMGDLFDFWFEYKHVVPKGYITVFNKFIELDKLGIKLHLFKGNHDLWLFRYLEEEFNIALYRKPEIVTVYDKVFFLAHGDGLGPGDRGYKLLRRIFESKFNQKAYSLLPADLAFAIANYFSKKSRISKQNKPEHKKVDNLKTEELQQYKYAKQISEQNPEIDYFVFGHLHKPRQINLNDKTTLTFVGDWLEHFSYAVFDGENLELKAFNKNNT